MFNGDAPRPCAVLWVANWQLAAMCLAGEELNLKILHHLPV